MIKDIYSSTEERNFMKIEDTFSLQVWKINAYNISFITYKAMDNFCRFTLIRIVENYLIMGKLGKALMSL